jgi:hypothetical protein
MAYLIDTHPVRAQWVAAVMTTVLAAALTWMTEPQSLRAYLLGPLAAGIAVFVAMGYLARRRAKRRERA